MREGEGKGGAQEKADRPGGSGREEGREGGRGKGSASRGEKRAIQAEV